ncbi:unnamed protein product, partial [Rhizoctonia solani]
MTSPSFIPHSSLLSTQTQHRAITLPESEQRAVLKNATRVRNLTPGIGTEIAGVDLTSLDGQARDQLALEVARRGVLVFRDQPKFLGRLEINLGSGEVTSGARHPPSIPELSTVYREANSVKLAHLSRLSTTLWHSDVSYELQPPATTTFFLLVQQSSGGDTLFVSQVLALKKLSPPSIEFLRTLKAVHSSVIQARESREGCRTGGQRAVRRDPVEHGMPFTSPIRAQVEAYVCSPPR